jgi:hypothetical protein
MRASSSCRRSNRAMRSACSACTCCRRTMSDCTRHVSLLLLYGVKAWLCGSIARVHHPNHRFKLFRAGFGTPNSCFPSLRGMLESLLDPPATPPRQPRRISLLSQYVLCSCLPLVRDWKGASWVTIVGWSVRYGAGYRASPLSSRRGRIAEILLNLFYDTRRMYGWHVSRHWIRKLWLNEFRCPAIRSPEQEGFGRILWYVI